MWAVTGTLTGRFSIWPSVVAILMKPSRYNTHQMDANSGLLLFMLHCLVSTARFPTMTTKMCTQLTVEGTGDNAENTSQTVVGTSQIAVGTSQSAVGTSQFAVGTSQTAIGTSQSVISM